MNLSQPLLFKWTVTKFWNWRLAFFIAVALLIHVAAFYLLQVVYPPTEPIKVQPMRVVVLDPGFPPAAELLRELEDRAFAYGPGVDTELDQFSLANLGVSFRPSFQGHQIELLPVEAMGGLHFSSLLSAGRLDLPPLPEVSDWTELQVSQEARESASPQVRVGRNLADRQIDVDSEALAKALRQPNGYLRARAGVLPDGRLLYLLISKEPEGGLAQAEVEILREVLRFEPGDALQQDWIEIIW